MAIEFQLEKIKVQEMNGGNGWLYNNAMVLNATELYTLKW